MVAPLPRPVKTRRPRAARAVDGGAAAPTVTRAAAPIAARPAGSAQAQERRGGAALRPPAEPGR